MGISSAQLLIILLIILVLFGAGRLPQVMSDLGKGIKAFKDSLDNDNKKKKDDEES
ncbi:twin arginine-targeting translocase, TatA/E family protein [Orientia chuto str. Dubai]|uniref:Sec-independent protein translocase protein TatA n=1 Tax=Orientia chuto str. Dubai TaxID=1359168 RepID=A0A0F3MMA9_9RICK|nr:twin-arginine translocase TatA/TatE family subunit [Candidatus Orientia mediorientalis]KJV56913.1 twin arginine-targeting translocase, TatA/E family protein [Orientia chuto str. Dubai]